MRRPARTSSQVRVWWPPTRDKSRTGFSGAFWPAAVVAHGKSHFTVRYDNDEEERVRAAARRPARRRALGAAGCRTRDAAGGCLCAHAPRDGRPGTLLSATPCAQPQVSYEHIFPAAVPLDFGREIEDLRVRMRRACGAGSALRTGVPRVREWDGSSRPHAQPAATQGVWLRARTMAPPRHLLGSLLQAPHPAPGWIQVGEFVEVSNGSKTDPCAWLARVLEVRPDATYLVSARALRGDVHHPSGTAALGAAVGRAGVTPHATPRGRPVCRGAAGALCATGGAHPGRGRPRRRQQQAGPANPRCNPPARPRCAPRAPRSSTPSMTRLTR